MKYLVTAKQRASTNALSPIVEELRRRNHEVTVYATGNDDEAAGFNSVGFEKIEPSDYKALLSRYDALITGASGKNTADGLFTKAAGELGMSSISVVDQNNNYDHRFGDILPTLIGVVDKKSIDTIRQELGEEAASRARVVGYTAFDKYAELRENFSETDREILLSSLSLNAGKSIYFHATQNIHPDTDYMKKSAINSEEKRAMFTYELGVTNTSFAAARDLGINLVVKPHPGEKYFLNFTQDLAKKFGFTYLAPSSCNTQQLMLASQSVTAGRSSCLMEAALLDRNTGAFLAGDMGREWASSCLPIALDAIPHTFEYYGIEDILAQVTSSDEKVLKNLAERRKRFSVDGKASKRLVDLVENL